MSPAISVAYAAVNCAESVAAAWALGRITRGKVATLANRRLFPLPPFLRAGDLRYIRDPRRRGERAPRREPVVFRGILPMVGSGRDGDDADHAVSPVHGADRPVGGNDPEGPPRRNVVDRDRRVRRDGVCFRPLRRRTGNAPVDVAPSLGHPGSHDMGRAPPAAALRLLSLPPALVDRDLLHLPRIRSVPDPRDTGRGLLRDPVRVPDRRVHFVVRDRVATSRNRRGTEKGAGNRPEAGEPRNDGRRGRPPVQQPAHRSAGIYRNGEGVPPAFLDRVGTSARGGGIRQTCRGAQPVDADLRGPGCAAKETPGTRSPWCRSIFP